MRNLVDNLKDTEYYSPLKRLRDSGAATLFDYDLALDLYYFTNIWKAKRRVLKNKELEIFTRDCGAKIDLLNMQLDLPSEEILQHAATGYLHTDDSDSSPHQGK